VLVLGRTGSIQSMPTHQPDLTLHRVLAISRRRAPIALACVLIAVAVSLAYSLTAQKQYTATASLLFNNAPLSQQIAGLQPGVNPNPISQQDTNLQLVSLGDMARKTATQLGHGLTRDAVLNSLTVSPSGDTTVVNVASTLSSPTLAAQVANTYARVFVDEQENGNHQYYQSALATLEQQIARLRPAQARSAQGLALQNRAQSLATLAQIRTGTVSLAQAARVPIGPSSPATKRNALIAALLGLLLGIVLALTIERLDQNIREASELEAIYDLPLLGSVPLNSSLRRSGRGSRPGEPPAAVSDAFQFIRARLRYFNVDRELHTVAIVSSQPGDGKTTVAHWLANAAATMGSRVLLIEADLRRPSVAYEVDLQSGPGLADILIGARSFNEATQAVKLVGTGGGGDDGRSLDVIVAGALPPNPAAMLESSAMADVLRWAKSMYDFVVIDTPPLGAVSDAMPLVKLVDGIVIVAQMGRNRRDAAQRLRATLAAVDAPLLGVIANRVKGRGAGYGYEYGYSSEQNDADRMPPSTIGTRGAMPARASAPTDVS
jgi:succinoglycan biosynthesis transport protein ExoP